MNTMQFDIPLQSRLFIFLVMRRLACWIEQLNEINIDSVGFETE